MATLYFNTFAATGAGDYDFWNPSNWFSDSDCTIPSAAPTSTDDAVFLSSCLGFSLEIIPHVNNAYVVGGVPDPNTGGEYYGELSITIYVDGLCSIYGATGSRVGGYGVIFGNCYFGGDYCLNFGTIYGDVTFGQYSGPNNGIINGNCIFEEENIEVGYGTINGDCEINNSWGGIKTSYLSIDGNATFRGNTANEGSISLDADVYYPAQKPLGGFIGGSVNYYGYPPNAAIPSLESPFSGTGVSYAFDGISGLKYENTGQFAVGTGDFTIEWFQKITSLDNFPRVFEIGAYPSTSIGVSIEGGTFYFWDSDGPHFASNVSSVLNQWVHFRVVRASGTLKGYLNGVSFASESNSNNISDSSTPLSIGCELVSGFELSENTGFQGNISNFRWESVALNTGNFVPPTAPLQSDANTIILVAGAETINPDNGVMAYWNLNNDGIGDVSLIDSTGNNNSLTNIDDVQLGTGLIGGDAVFNQTNFLKTGSGFAPESGQRTYAGWVKFNQTPTSYQFVFTHGGTSDYQSVIPFYLESNGTASSIFTTENGYWGYTLTTSITPQAGVWNHFATTFDGATARLYFNGILVASNIYDGSIPAADIDAYALGSYPALTGLGGLDGSVDEVGIWDRALTLWEVAYLYNNGSGVTYPFMPPTPSTMRKISLGTLLNLPFPVDAIYDKRPIFGVSTLLNTPFYINK